MKAFDLIMYFSKQKPIDSLLNRNQQANRTNINNNNNTSNTSTSNQNNFEQSENAVNNSFDNIGYFKIEEVCLVNIFSFQIN